MEYAESTAQWSRLDSPTTGASSGPLTWLCRRPVRAAGGRARWTRAARLHPKGSRRTGQAKRRAHAKRRPAAHSIRTALPAADKTEATCRAGPWPRASSPGAVGRRASRRRAAVTRTRTCASPRRGKGWRSRPRPR
eukprot:scaffold11463_cov124-Isochrysis_galbana.AAC.7